MSELIWGRVLFIKLSSQKPGKAAVNRSFSTSELNLRKAFADVPGEIHVHLEAGELTLWAVSIIEPLVHRGPELV